MEMQERYRAAMVLSGVGDALGYGRGRWEFCTSGITIYEELIDRFERVDRIAITKGDWPVSDDTLLHIATAKSLLEHGVDENKDKLYKHMAIRYVESMTSKDMNHRHPGNTCLSASRFLTEALKNRSSLFGHFDKHGGGCGAAIRSMCIGLVYPDPDQIQDLVEISIESGRLTHHHPTAYLGSMASALFTAYAIQGKPIIEWGKGLVDSLSIALDYLLRSGIDVQKNLDAMDYFKGKWTGYLKLRDIADGKSEPIFPRSYGIYERDQFYRSISFSGTGGASGHDAPLIAYDALLGCQNDWEELCLRGMLHGGDSDSTGVIAGALYGAINGFNGVSKLNHECLEFRKELDKLGTELFKLSKKVVEHDKKKAPVKTEISGSNETPL